ncbi:MAG: asparaginase [Acidobacteriota bacterium]
MTDAAPTPFLDGLVPLVVGTRGDDVDYVTLGAAVTCDAAGEVHRSWGDPELPAYLRSSAKPLQVLPFLRRLLPRRLDLGMRAIAVACASHSGEDEHVAAVTRILDAVGLTEEHLGCGTHDPVRSEEAARVARGELTLGPLRNNCSGKHAAMLATCVHEEWDLASYRELEHPLQQECLEIVATFAGVEPDSIRVAVDNCSLPTFSLPLRASARAAARWREPQGLPEDLAMASTTAVAAMTAQPFMVGGTGRFDTALMEVTEGRLCVKTGANGFYIGSYLAEPGAEARGFALKLAGAEGEARKSLAVLGCLEQLGWLDDDERAALADRFPSPLRGCRDQEVGRERFVG